jgi:chromosome segregation ATPase
MSTDHTGFRDSSGGMEIPKVGPPITHQDRQMRESASELAEVERKRNKIQRRRSDLESRKPELDRRVSVLWPLHNSIRDNLKRAFDAAKKYNDATLPWDKERYSTLFASSKNYIDDRMYHQYKPKRNGLLADIDSLNEEIRRHNEEIRRHNGNIQTGRNQGQSLSNGLKVSEYPKENVPNDIQHGQDLDEVIHGRLWEQYENESP